MLELFEGGGVSTQLLLLHPAGTRFGRNRLILKKTAYANRIRDLCYFLKPVYFRFLLLSISLSNRVLAGDFKRKFSRTRWQEERAQSSSPMQVSWKNPAQMKSNWQQR